MRYVNIYKTFYSLQDGIDFIEKILNDQIEVITKEDIIVSCNINKRKKLIVVETKGVLDNDNQYFTERYDGEFPSEAQIENFLSSIANLWKLVFVKLNKEYKEKLYKRKLIGFKHVDRIENNPSIRIDQEATAPRTREQPRLFQICTQVPAVAQRL